MDKKPTVSLSLGDLRTKVLEVVKEAKKQVDLTGAEVIVSVGGGISKDKEEGIKPAKVLAIAFGGGVVGGSRAQLMQAGLLQIIRWDRQVKSYVLESISPLESPVQSSILQECRMQK